MRNSINFVVLAGIVVEKNKPRLTRRGNNSLSVVVEINEWLTCRNYKSRFEVFFTGEKADKASKEIEVLDQLKVEGRLSQLRYETRINAHKFEITKPEDQAIRL